MRSNRPVADAFMAYMPPMQNPISPTASHPRASAAATASPRSRPSLFAASASNRFGGPSGSAAPGRSCPGNGSNVASAPSRAGRQIVTHLLEERSQPPDVRDDHQTAARAVDGVDRRWCAAGQGGVHPARLPSGVHPPDRHVAPGPALGHRHDAGDRSPRGQLRDGRGDASARVGGVFAMASPASTCLRRLGLHGPRSPRTPAWSIAATRSSGSTIASTGSRMVHEPSATAASITAWPSGRMRPSACNRSIRALLGALQTPPRLRCASNSR